MTANSQLGDIPEELRRLPQWVRWRIENRKSGTTKVPMQVSGAPASSTDSKTWSTYKQVLGVTGQFDGIGFVFTKESGYAGVDFDKCRDPKTGETEAWVLAILEELDSYTELSQSGTGWHVIVKGSLPPGGNRKGRVEMYDHGRYFCMTGAMVPGIGRRTIESRDLAGLQKRMMAGKFGSSLKAKPARDESASVYDFRLIGKVQRQVRTSNAAVLEEAFRKQYPERYAERNHEKGDRNGKNYTLYSIEKFLAGNQMDSNPTRVGSRREDSSNAERFAEQHCDTVRFWHKRDVWLVWTGSHWQEDGAARVVELAKQTARSIYHEAASMSEDAAAKMGQWAERTLNCDKILDMLKLAKSDPRIAVTTDKLDSNQYLLNFENGTVDLRTGELRAHRREDYITKIVRSKYTQGLIGPRWLLFVEQMFGDLADWVQKAIGYSLTGITSEKVVFLLLGPTDTGKTTFLTTLKTIFADYSSMLQIDTLMCSRTQDSNMLADLADLRGARFVVTSETEEGQRLREAKRNALRKAWAKSRLSASTRTRSPFLRPTSSGLMQTLLQQFVARTTQSGKGSFPYRAITNQKRKTLNFPANCYMNPKVSPVGSLLERFAISTRGSNALRLSK